MRKEKKKSKLRKETRGVQKKNPKKNKGRKMGKDREDKQNTGN